MKKIIISALFILGFGSYVAYSYASANSSQAVATTALPTQAAPSDTAATPIVPATPSTAVTTNTAPTQNVPVVPVTKVPATPVTPAVTGQYKDGTYTGSVADAYYGNLQVKAVVTGGKLSSIIFLQYPKDRSTSKYLNEQAIPTLTAEAIKSQSAKVDGVSGASDSSAAFTQSLSVALAKAAV
jgi:uncharacterized protein with FMN-binding domain